MTVYYSFLTDRQIAHLAYFLLLRLTNPFSLLVTCTYKALACDEKVTMLEMAKNKKKETLPLVLKRNIPICDTSVEPLLAYLL